MSRSTRITWTFETTITDFSETTPPPTSTSTSTIKSPLTTSGVTQATTTTFQSSSVALLPSDTSTALASTRTVTSPTTTSGSSRGSNRESGSPSSGSTSSGSSWTTGTTPVVTPSSSSSAGVPPRSIPVVAIIVGAIACVALLVCALLLFTRLRHQRRKPDIDATPFIMESASAPRNSSHRFYSSLDSDNSTNASIDRVTLDSYRGDDVMAPTVMDQRIPRGKLGEKQEQPRSFPVTQAEDLRQSHQIGGILAVPPSAIVHQDSGTQLPQRETNVIDIPPAYTP